MLTACTCAALLAQRCAPTLPCPPASWQLAAGIPLCRHFPAGCDGLAYAYGCVRSLTACAWCMCGGSVLMHMHAVQVLRAVQAEAAGLAAHASVDADQADSSATVACERPLGYSGSGDTGTGSMDAGMRGSGEAGGRRWFSMFARRSSTRTSSEGVPGAPSSAPVLASMHGEEPAAGALIGMSSDIAQRRVGTQAVFNPTAHVNEDDAQFLRSAPALSNVSATDPPLEEIREPAQPSGSPALARTSELADISGSGTQSSLSLPIDKRQVLPSAQKRS